MQRRARSKSRPATSPACAARSVHPRVCGELDDKVETKDAVYAVRDIEAGRWGVKLTAERTT